MRGQLRFQVCLALALAPSAAVQTAYQFNGGVLYKEAFLSPADFEAVRRECRSLRGRMRAEKDSIALGRLGLCLDCKSVTHATLMSESVAQYVARLTGVPKLEPSDFPAEMRHYGSGAQMGWHRDDMLYDPPQTEVIFTIDNSADCFTEWFCANGERDCAWSEPNSVLLVRAGSDGPSHRVTPVKRGERTIVKLVFHEPAASKTPNFYVHINSFPGAQKSVAERARALNEKVQEKVQSQLKRRRR